LGLLLVWVGGGFRFAKKSFAVVALILLSNPPPPLPLPPPPPPLLCLLFFLWLPYSFSRWCLSSSRKVLAVATKITPPPPPPELQKLDPRALFAKAIGAPKQKQGMCFERYEPIEFPVHHADGLHKHFFT
jgi:hypothetical protein